MDEIAKKMAELSTQYGPTVIDAARGAVRVEAYSQLVAGGICLVASAGLIAVLRYAWPKANEDNFGWVLCMCAAMLGLLFLLPLGVWSFADPWTWTAITHPDLYLAKRVIFPHH